MTCSSPTFHYVNHYSFAFSPSLRKSDLLEEHEDESINDQATGLVPAEIFSVSLTNLCPNEMGAIEGELFDDFVEKQTYHLGLPPAAFVLPSCHIVDLNQANGETVPVATADKENVTTIRRSKRLQEQTETSIDKKRTKPLSNRKIQNINRGQEAQCEKVSIMVSAKPFS